MAVLTGEIAQFVVPSDSIGNPNAVTPDLAHNVVYFMSNGGLRKYATTFATQNPLVSLPGLPGGSSSANILAVDTAGNPLLSLNTDATIYKLDPATLEVAATFGSTSGTSYPTGIGYTNGDVDRGIVCVAAGGVPYAVIKEGVLSQAAGIIRTDTMTAAGWHGNVSTGWDGSSLMCPGKSGTAGSAGSVFLLDWVTINTSSASVYRIDIGATAPAYDIASWPMPNPAITAAMIATIHATDINPSWTALTSNAIGYDATNDIVVLDITGDTGQVIIGLNGSTGAIVWKYPTPSAASNVMTVANNSRAQVPIVGNGSATYVDGIASGTGTVTTNTVNGLGTTSRNQFFNDDTKIIFAEVNYTEASDTPQPVDGGTPSSFDGWAMLNLWPFSTSVQPPTPSNNRNLGGWRGGTGLNWKGMALVGDSFQNIIGLSDFNSLEEYGQPQRFLITSPPLHDDRKRIFIPRLEIEVEAGLGEEDGPSGAVMMLLEMSKDGGETWLPLRTPRSMGAVGDYVTRLRWLNLGHARTWMFRLSCFDPVRRFIIGSYVDSYKAMG